MSSPLHDIARILASINKLFNDLKDSIIGELPHPLSPLLEVIYRMDDAKEEDVEKMVKKLREAGHGELVEKILDKEPRILVGVIYIYGRCGESAYSLYNSLRESPPKNIVVEDFSTDALTVADYIRRAKADRVVVLAIKRRGRQPGVYVYNARIQQPSPEDAVEDIRPSLEGLLDVDALIMGLNVFLGEGELTVIECEPSSDDCSDCIEKIREKLGEVAGWP